MSEQCQAIEGPYCKLPLGHDGPHKKANTDDGGEAGWRDPFGIVTLQQVEESGVKPCMWPGRVAGEHCLLRDGHGGAGHSYENLSGQIAWERHIDAGRARLGGVPVDDFDQKVKRVWNYYRTPAQTLMVPEAFREGIREIFGDHIPGPAQPLDREKFMGASEVAWNEYSRGGMRHDLPADMLSQERLKFLKAMRFAFGFQDKPTPGEVAAAAMLDVTPKTARAKWDSLAPETKAAWERAAAAAHRAIGGGG